MMTFLRSLFGFGNVAGNRTVVGSPESLDAKDVPYVQESTKRLVALQELHLLFKCTAYASKIRMVYDKTQRIHTYLIGRKRGHELELFHVQHTDHFLNTFTTILNAHQQQEVQLPSLAPPPPPPAPAASTEVVGRTLVFGPFRSYTKEVKSVRARNHEVSQRAFADIAEANIDVPKLTEPQISIDTYSKIVYLREDISDGVTTNEIGFTSTPEEKEAFASYVAARLGLTEITYVGNAMVYLPSHNNSQPAEMVPIIHWNNAPYALSLEDYRLYPVRTYRKSR